MVCLKTIVDSYMQDEINFSKFSCMYLYHFEMELAKNDESCFTDQIWMKN